jgi:hypothetical protein
MFGLIPGLMATAVKNDRFDRVVIHLRPVPKPWEIAAWAARTWKM